MKVWVVTNWSEAVAVFSTEQLANEFIDRQHATEKHQLNYEIEKYEVDGGEPQGE